MARTKQIARKSSGKKTSGRKSSGRKSTGSKSPRSASPVRRSKRIAGSTTRSQLYTEMNPSMRRTFDGVIGKNKILPQKGIVKIKTKRTTPKKSEKKEIKISDMRIGEETLKEIPKALNAKFDELVSQITGLVVDGSKRITIKGKDVAEIYGGSQTAAGKHFYIHRAPFERYIRDIADRTANKKMRFSDSGVIALMVIYENMVINYMNALIALALVKNKVIIKGKFIRELPELSNILCRTN
jgi:histone H3/H4